MQTARFAIAVALSGLCAASAQADSVVRLKAGVSANTYAVPIAGSTVNIESSFMALNLSAGLIGESGWFGELGLKNSLGAEWNYSEFVPGNPDQDFSRTETNITVGKVLGGGLSVFGGFMSTGSKLSFPGSPDDSLDSTVFFAGLGKSFQIGNGSLGLSGAIGVLTAEYDDGLGTVEKSDTGAGVSLGASYAHFLSSSLALSGDLKVQSYGIKWKDGTSDQEVVTSVGLSLISQF